MITFTFDDFPRSAYAVAGPILKKYHARGTYYISMNLLHSDAPLGPHCSLDDIRNLVADGHELGCHTFSHCDASTTHPSVYQNDVLENAKAIRTVLPSYHFRSFAYPYGRVTLRVKKIVAGLFDCCRGTYSGINTEQTDLNLLRSNGLSNESAPMSKVQTLIDRNREMGGWLIFYTHDVCDNYSSWGCSTDYFEAVLKYASDSGSRILTISESLDTLENITHPQMSNHR